MMNSIPRILNIVAILTKNKDRKQIFLSIKLYKWRIKWLLPEQEEVALVFTGTKLDTKFNIKDKTSKEHQRDLTYSVVCPDANCSEEYNGETGRRLIERVHEHSGKDVSFHVFKHLIETDHPTVTTDDFRVLKTGSI